MFSRIGPSAFKKDLTNIWALCRFLGNPQQRIRTIHIAGTNGKGSVSHMLAAILQTAGYKTGLYTSPHLKDFRERIKINGQMVPQQFVIDFTRQIIPEINRYNPSFFEITVAMAFAYFQREATDITIIETGLGGRLDSTNIITPELSIITNIDWDHMDMLGDSLEKIAFEKAGIIKQQVPVVIGESLPETRPVFEKVATQQNAPLSFASEEWQVHTRRWEDNEFELEVSSARNQHRQVFRLDLPGAYQEANLLAVLQACVSLKQLGYCISNDHMYTALRQVKQLTRLHGRWEIIRQEPLVILDVAHNAGGISQVLQQLKKTAHKKLHIIIGLVKDKDPGRVLKLLPRDALYYFTRAAIPRAMDEVLLQKEALQYGLKGATFSRVNTALHHASLHAAKDDLILVCGSIFLVGEVSLPAVNEIWSTKHPDGFWNGIFETIESIH